MVENITILKDASAAIYGAAGAKGVVLVTTKRGKQGKPTISYNGYYGVNDAAKKPEFLSAVQLANLLNDGYRMLGTTTGGIRASDFFTQQDIQSIQDANYESWYDQLWSASIMQRHNLNISGGNDRTRFYASGSIQREDGLMKNWVVSEESGPTGINAAPNEKGAGMKYNTKEYFGK